MVSSTLAASPEMRLAGEGSSLGEGVLVAVILVVTIVVVLASIIVIGAIIGYVLTWKMIKKREIEGKNIPPRCTPPSSTSVDVSVADCHSFSPSNAHPRSAEVAVAPFEKAP